jgi:hypothetical protein
MSKPARQSRKKKSRTGGAATAVSKSPSTTSSAVSSAKASTENKASGSGRPSDYTEAIAAEFCARIAQGMTVREICKADDMPAVSTIFLWLFKQRAFSEQYARACEARTAAFAEETLQIADDAMPIQGRVDKERLRIDTRKWLMSKMFPKKYGDSTTLKGDPDAPLHAAVIIVPKKDVATANTLATEPPTS